MSKDSAFGAPSTAIIARQPSLAWRVFVATLLGIVVTLLYVSATLKLVPLLRDVLWFPNRLPIVGSTAVLALCLLEVTVAALVGYCRHFARAWFVAAGFFIVLAIVSSVRAFMGVSTCGCFGDVSVSPRTIAIADGVIAACLWCVGRRLSRPANGNPSIPWRSCSHIMLGAAIVLSASGFLGAIAGTRMQPLVVYSGGIEAEWGEEGRLIEARVPIVNTSDRTLVIGGAKTGCSVAVDRRASLPVSLAPRQEYQLPVRARVVPNSRSVIVTFVLFAGNGRLRSVVIRADLRVPRTAQRVIRRDGKSVGA